MRLLGVGVAVTVLVLCSIGVGAARAGEAEKAARSGVDAYAKKNYEKALQDFQQAAHLDPASAAIQYDLGTTLAAKGDYEKAAEALKHAIDFPKTPSPAHAHYNLGYTEVQKSQADKGADKPKDPKAQLETLRSGLDEFRQSIIADPVDPDAKHNYELTKEMIRQLEEQMRKQDQQNNKQQDKKNQDDKNKQDQKGQDQKQQNQKDKDQKDKDQKDKDQQNQKDQNKSDEQKNDKDQKQDDKKPDQNDPSKSQDQQKSQDQKNGDGKEDSKQQNGLEATPTPGPTPTGKPNSNPAPGEGDAKPPEKPLTPEQLDALRVLNSLQENHPDQFKKLFRFQGRANAPRLKKDW